MSENVSGTVMVIGAGVAGMTSAMELAKMGHKVHLVEQESALGGLNAQLQVVPKGGSLKGFVGSLINKISDEKNITVHLSTAVGSMEGKVNDFKVTLEGGKKEIITAGVLIVATGASIFDASRLPEFKFGRSDSIITALDFQRLLDAPGTPAHPGTGQPVSSVGFVQCVGSRMETRGNPWCSNICCAVTVKQVLKLHERDPRVRCAVFYMDIRTVDRGQEQQYAKSRENGTRYVRGIPSEIIPRSNGKVLVRAEDASIGKIVEREFDILVLAAGLEPGPGTKMIQEVLGISPIGDGFIPLVDKNRPYATPVEGILVAGMAEFPKMKRGSILQAKAAALEADLILRSK